MLEKELCPQTRFKVNAREGGLAWEGVCGLLSTLGKKAASESPTATSAPWLPREGPPHPCGHLPPARRAGPPCSALPGSPLPHCTAPRAVETPLH